MNRILLASVAVLGMAGAAAAADAGDGTPGIYGGRYSGDVLQANNANNDRAPSWGEFGSDQRSLSGHAMSSTNSTRLGHSTNRMVRTKHHPATGHSRYGG